MSEFCQYRTGGLRCVLRLHTTPHHELMPLLSASVRIINRQEAQESRLTQERVLHALDKAVASAPAPESPVATTRTPPETVGPAPVPAERGSTND